MRTSPLPSLLFLGITLLALAACSESQASRVDERTFRIESPRIPGGAVGPNQRLADQFCPRGYRVLNESRDTDNYQGGVSVIWTIRCL
jgi:hypothetical protein